MLLTTIPLCSLKDAPSEAEEAKEMVTILTRR